MADDAAHSNMDTPQISTLREEDTPPPPAPPPARPHIPTLKFRVKPPVPDPTTTAVGGSSASGKGTTPAPEDEDEEEDQLIDDDDIASTNDPQSAVPSTSTTPLKRRASKGKAPRKGVKKSRAGEKGDTTILDPQQRDNAAIITTFDLQTPDAQVNRALPAPGENWEASLSTGGPPSASTGSTRGRKRGAGRKVAGAPRVRKTDSKSSLAATVITAPQLDETLSEAYSGTAPSSPAAFGAHDFPDGDADGGLVDSIIPPLSLEDIKLDQVPLPVYPLPSKPFSVLPPPKIGSGFAPIIPIDRSGAKVRRWRTVHREVRGIAGGRWFARAWVGDKESEVAALTASIPSAVGGPTSISTASSTVLSAVTAPTKGQGRKLKSLSLSADASRSGSLAPDHSVRAPSKMRTSVVAPEVDIASLDS